MSRQSSHTPPPAERRRRGLRSPVITVLVALLALLVAAEAAQAYSHGQRIWLKKYGTAARQVHFGALAVGPNGVACAVGQQGRAGDDDQRGVVVLYNAAGKRLWARTYPAGASTDFCELTHVAFGPSGTIYVAGQRQVKGSPPNLVVVKYSLKGALQWSRLYDGPAHLTDYPGGLAVDGKGFIYASCSSQVSSSVFAAAVVKYSAKGKRVWATRVEPSGTLNNRDLAIDGARNVYVVGNLNAGGLVGFHLVKLSGASGAHLGSTTWRPDAEGGVADATSLAIRGSWVVVGGYGYAMSGATRDALVAAYDLGLKERYTPVFYNGSGHGNDALFDVAVDGRGNVIGTGDAYVQNPYTDAALTFKVGPAGTLPVLWYDEYLGPSNDAEGEAVVVDGTGNAYVAGYCANATQWDNLLVAKYAAGATYRRTWLKTWGGEYNAGNDAAIALGPSGTLYVSCEGQSKDGVYQGVIAKYAR